MPAHCPRTLEVQCPPASPAVAKLQSPSQLLCLKPTKPQPPSRTCCCRAAELQSPSQLLCLKPTACRLEAEQVRWGSESPTLSALTCCCKAAEPVWIHQVIDHGCPVDAGEGPVLWRPAHVRRDFPPRRDLEAAEVVWVLDVSTTHLGDKCAGKKYEKQPCACMHGGVVLVSEHRCGCAGSCACTCVVRD